MDNPETIMIPTPLGNLILECRGGALCTSRIDVSIPGGQDEPASSPLLELAKREVLEYFSGELRNFTIPLCPAGTAFQLNVWAALRTIPYGETRTYGEIAAMIGKPGAVRAVGGACGANPLLLFTPCHRVVAAGGIGGFSAGLKLKYFLLDWEAAVTAKMRGTPSSIPLRQ